MFCRTQGVISVCPSFCLSVRPPPPGWPSRPKILTLRHDFGPLSPKISRPGLKSALQTLNQLSRPQISSQGLKSALQSSNLLSRPQISVPGLKSALQASNLPLMPQAYPWISYLIFRPKVFPYLKSLLGLIYSPSGRLEITPCVLQDISPLGPLPKKHENWLAIFKKFEKKN